MTAHETQRIASIVEYLREPFAFPSSTTNEVATAKPKQKRLTKKARPAEPYSPSTESDEVVQKLPKGRVRYGPITVNPRKEPSKTLFTGRRSKNEVLSPDEEERRRDRRERNRVAATKCREKRESVLFELEEQCQDEETKYEELNRLVEKLQTRKHELEVELNQHSDECFAFPNLINHYPTSTCSSMIFGDPTFLSSMPESRIPQMPLNDPILSYSEEDEQNTPPIDNQSFLTNSAYSNGDSNSQWRTQEDMMIAFTTSSLERLMISIRSPTQSMDVNNTNNSANLVNSNSTATCSKQSGFNEEESVAPAIVNRFIC